ncbi:MAG: hypothetical protein PHI28_17875, partial [Mangrovibacterium sp.]|nr:hypothetical protein [Mangrovibacterium sp.]
MIVRMIKYTFAVHHRFYTQFLDDLQNLEVVHIDRTREQKVAGEAADLTHEAGLVHQTLEQFKNYRHDGPTGEPFSLTVKEVAEQAGAWEKRLADCRSALEQLQETIRAREIWGDYSDQLVSELGDQGIKLRFYTMPARKFSQSWLQLFPIEIVSRSEREIHFVWIGTGDITFEGARELHPPREEVAELRRREEELKNE